MSGPNGARVQLVWWWRARWWQPWPFFPGPWPYRPGDAVMHGCIYRARFGFWVLEVRLWA